MSKVKYVATKALMGVAALALTFTVSTAVQADQDLSVGEYHIVAAGETKAKGWMLATSKDQLIASNRIGGIRWKFQSVGKTTAGAPLFLITEADNYLVAKNGKPLLVKQKPGAKEGRWIVIDGGPKGGNYAILYNDDDQSGGNALSLPNSDEAPVVDANLTNDRNVVYKAGIERHNAGGQGHEHQQWEIRKRSR